MAGKRQEVPGVSQLDLFGQAPVPATAPVKHERPPCKDGLHIWSYLRTGNGRQMKLCTCCGLTTVRV